MHCPKCNTELASGNVYCPKCGQEVQIVPDYDPLDEVLLDEPEEKKNRKNETTEVPERRKKKTLFKMYVLRCLKDPVLLKLLILCGCLILCAGVAAGAYLVVRREHTYSYQVQKGMDLYEKGSLEEAILCFKHAMELQSEEYREDERPLFYLAYIYEELGEVEIAIKTIESLLNYPLPEKQKLETYEKLFFLMQESGDAERINDVIESCKDEILQKRLLPYRIEKPTINMSAGEYHYYIYPKLEAAYGTIYYTLDGSTPTRESMQYNGRIELKEGENLMTAVAINEKGIVSEPLFVVYRLNFDDSAD